jgi:hypothetical protein
MQEAILVQDKVQWHICADVELDMQVHNTRAGYTVKQ